MGRPAIKGAGVDDIHGGLFGRFVDGYVAHIIAVGGKQGERTVARLKLEGRSQPGSTEGMIRLASTRTGTGCNTFIGALSLRLMYQKQQGINNRSTVKNVGERAVPAAPLADFRHVVSRKNRD